jgi:hypothetical protein
MVPTPNPPGFILFRRSTVFKRHPFSGPADIFGKALEGEAARVFTLRGVIRRLAFGTLLLALGCSPSSVDEKKPIEPLSASNATPAEKTAASPLQTPAPDLRAAQPAEAVPPVSEAFPADVPVYPDGSITKAEAGPGGFTLLLSSQKPWENLMDFYTSSLTPAGWKPVQTGSPGQTLARFEKGGRALVIQMQPGRQDEKLVRILYTTNSVQRQ